MGKSQKRRSILVAAVLSMACLVCPAVAQAAGQSAGSCTIGVSTFAQCFPDINFARAVAASQYRSAKVTDVLTQDFVDKTTELSPAWWHYSDDTGEYSSYKQRVTSLQGIQVFKNLTRLYAYETDITDITPLAGLTKLEMLSISKTKVSDLSAVAGLKNLTDLEIYEDPVTSIAPVAHLTKLEKFEAFSIPSNGHALDITPLAGLTNLKELNLLDNGLSDITPLQNLTKLEQLNLVKNHITDITPLHNMTNLWQLYLTKNQITDVTPLSGMGSKLKQLFLGNNKISDISTLGGLKHLDMLELNANPIKDISPLSNLSNLREVFLCGNNLTSLSPIAGLSSLTELYVEDNAITDISDLKGLSRLWLLDIPGNHVTDLSPLSGLKELREVCFDNNSIMDLTPLAGSAYPASDGTLMHRGTADDQKIELPARSVKSDTKLSIPAVKDLNGKYVPITSSAPTGATLDSKNGVVTWPSTVRAGTYSYTFKENGEKEFPYSGTVSVKVTVTGQKVITKVDNPSVTTDSGKAPSLPATVGVTFSDGTTGTAAVSWQACDKSLYSMKQGGTFTVQGTVNGQFAQGVSPTVTATVTVRAATLVVSFDSAGGSSVVSQSVVAGGRVVRPVDPSRSGYVFAGWYTKDGKAFDFNSSVTADVRLVARWRPVAASVVFRDVSSSTPHASDIAWLADTGVSTGWLEPDGSYSFRGMDSVKRQDMAAFLYRLAVKAGRGGGVRPGSCRDVSDATPHASEVRGLGGSGGATGYADGTFRGMLPVYRQDMAAFLHRFDGLK